MGYIIDARFFRLGNNTGNWSSSWVADGHKYNVYLNEDFILNEFIKNAFLLDGVPHCTYRKRRWFSNNNQGLEKKKEPHRFTYTIDNPFMRAGGDLMLSHVCLNRKGIFFDIQIYLLDAELEDIRLNFDVEGTKTISNIIFENFLNKHYLDKEFKKKIKLKKYTNEKDYLNDKFNIFYKINKKKDYQDKAKYLEIKNKIITIKKLMALYYQKEEMIFYNSFINIEKKGNNFKLVDKDKDKEEQNIFGFEPIKQYFQIFKAILILFEKFSKVTLKKNLFFFLILRNCLEQLFSLCFLGEGENNLTFIYKIFLIKRRYLVKDYIQYYLRNFEQKINYKFQDLNKIFIKDFFIKNLKNFFKSLFKFYFSVVLREFNVKSLALTFFKTISKKRTLLFKTLNYSIHNHVNIMTQAPYSIITFNGLHSRNLSANLLVNYIITKLRQYFTIQDIMNPLINDLNKSKLFCGYKIIIAGRLTRKERAAYMVYKDGTTPSNSMGQYLDYAADHLAMKFGAVGVKIWLHVMETRPPYYYYKFTNDSKY